MANQKEENNSHYWLQLSGYVTVMHTVAVDQGAEPHQNADARICLD